MRIKRFLLWKRMLLLSTKFKLILSGKFEKELEKKLAHIIYAIININYNKLYKNGFSEWDK